LMTVHSREIRAVPSHSELILALVHRLQRATSYLLSALRKQEMR